MLQCNTPAIHAVPTTLIYCGRPSVW